MEKKDVIISIEGLQIDPDGAQEKVELITHGFLQSDPELGYSLTYEESELTGMNGTTTSFQIGENQITLRRQGSLNSEMVFQEGERHVSLYDTGFGGLMIGVNTQRAWADIGLSGGKMELRYIVEVENRAISENVFHVEVREPNYDAATIVMREETKE